LFLDLARRWNAGALHHLLLERLRLKNHSVREKKNREKPNAKNRKKHKTKVTPRMAYLPVVVVDFHAPRAVDNNNKASKKSPP
jgi:hypothetical protein